MDTSKTIFPSQLPGKTMSRVKGKKNIYLHITENIARTMASVLAALFCSTWSWYNIFTTSLLSSIYQVKDLLVQETRHEGPTLLPQYN